MSSSEGRRARRDGGYVTAEAAVVLPTLVLFTMALVWALLAASAQIQWGVPAPAGGPGRGRPGPRGRA
ncbi:hypothetical protein ACFVZ2_05515, partial [Streptomyces lasiicapitis]